MGFNTKSMFHSALVRRRFTHLRRVDSFDLDYPVECDDEYWVTPDPSMAFQQPPEKPSLIAFFNCMLRLNQIHAFAMRTIVRSSQLDLQESRINVDAQYSTNKSKALLGFVGSQWEERIVAELDSAMNAWIDSVPHHREQPTAVHLQSTDSISYSTLGR